MKNKWHWWLICICVAYFIVHSIAVVWFEPTVLNIESDNLLYDSKLVSEGVVPFKELFTRSLVPLYVNAAIFAIFGIHVKLTSIAVYFFSSLALYFFGRVVLALFKKQPETLVAVSIMAVFGVRGFSDFFLYLGLWALMVWHRRPRFWLLFVSGASIGLSVLSYSAYITWCIAIMIFIAANYVKDVSNHNHKFLYVLKSQMAFAIGCAVTLLLPIFYFISITDWQWMADSFMADSFIYAYIISIIVGLISLSIFYVVKRDISIIGKVAPLVGILMILLFFYKENPGVSVKIAVIHDFFRVASWLLVPFFILFVSAALQLFKKQLAFVRPVAIITSLVFFYIATVGTFHLSRGPSLSFGHEGRVYFFTLIILYAVVFFLYIRSTKKTIPNINYWQYLVIVLPVVVIFAASLTYSDWLPTYIYNYSFSIVIAASVVFVFFWNSASMYAKQFLWVCGIGILCSYVVFPKLTKGTDQFNPSTEIQTTNAWQVVQYIQANTKPSDTIFTAVPFFALRSGRNMTLPITHPVVYTSKQDDPKPYDPYSVIPAVSEIQEQLKKTSVEYIILDERTRSLFLSDRHPEITKYIKKNYKAVQEFGNIKILKKLD